MASDLISFINKELKLKKSFEFVIKSHKRKQLYILWKNLNTKKSNSEVFEQTFGKKHTDANDYLLRNELRLLRAELRDFIANTQFEQMPANDKWEHYLQMLLNHGATTLFEKEYSKQLRNAEATGNHAQIVRLVHLHTQYTNKYLPRNAKVYKQQLLQQELLKDALSKQFVEGYRHSEAEVGRIDRSLLAHDTAHNVSRPTEQIAIQPSSVETHLARYYYVKALSYSVQSEDKVAKLNEAISLLGNVHKSLIDHRYEYGLLYSNLGVELFLRNQFNQAIPALAQAIAHTNTNTPHYPFILFNYCSALLKCDKYKQAIEILEENERHWKKVPNIAFRVRCLTVATLICLGRLKEAKSSIPQSFNEGTKDDICYLRLCLAIIFYKRNDIELAITEVDNLRRVANEPPALEYIQRTTSYFKRFLTLSENPNEKRLNKLRKEMISFLKEPLMNDNTSLPIRYIGKELIGIGEAS